MSIIKPRGLISVSRRSICEGMVFCACPGIDVPYELFSKKTCTIVGAPTLAKGSPFGYCYNDNGGAPPDPPYIKFPHSPKMKTMADKYSVFMMCKPSQIGGTPPAGTIFATAYDDVNTNTAPYATLLMRVEGSGKIGVYQTYTTSAGQYNTSAGVIFSANVWAKVLLVRNGTKTDVWLDGLWKEQWTLSQAGGLVWKNGVHFIGISNWITQDDYFKGDIAQVTCWDRCLNNSEAALLSAFPYIHLQNGTPSFDDYVGVVPGGWFLTAKNNYMNRTMGLR